MQSEMIAFPARIEEDEGAPVCWSWWHQRRSKANEQMGVPQAPQTNSYGAAAVQV